MHSQRSRTGTRDISAGLSCKLLFMDHVGVYKRNHATAKLSNRVLPAGAGNSSNVISPRKIYNGSGPVLESFKAFRLCRSYKGSIAKIKAFSLEAKVFCCYIEKKKKYIYIIAQIENSPAFECPFRRNDFV